MYIAGGGRFDLGKIEFMERSSLPVTSELNHVAGTDDAVLPLARIDWIEKSIGTEAQLLADGVGVAHDHTNRIHGKSPFLRHLARFLP